MLFSSFCFFSSEQQQRLQPPQRKRMLLPRFIFVQKCVKFRCSHSEPKASYLFLNLLISITYHVHTNPHFLNFYNIIRKGRKTDNLFCKELTNNFAVFNKNRLSVLSNAKNCDNFLYVYKQVRGIRMKRFLSFCSAVFITAISVIMLTSSVMPAFALTVDGSISQSEIDASNVEVQCDGNSGN